MAYTPNYVLPTGKDKSYVMLLIVTASLKRSIQQFVIFNSFPEKEEEKLINIGEKVIEGKVSPEKYISELENICKTLKGKEIEFSSDFKHRITAILLQNIPSKGSLDTESQKQVNKDGTDKQTTYQPAFKESKSQIKETKQFTGGYYIEDPTEGSIPLGDEQSEVFDMQPTGFTYVPGTEAELPEMYTGGIENKGDILDESLGFNIDQRYQRLSNVNKQLTVALFREMGELLLTGIDKKMLDELADYVSDYYNQFSKHKQIQVDGLMQQLYPEKWKEPVKVDQSTLILNSASKSLEESKEDDGPPYFFYIKDMGKECIIRVGYPLRGNGTETNYKERLVRGEAPYSLGSKTYQSYLTGDKILSWLKKDYEFVEPISSESEFDKFLPETPTEPVEEATKPTNTKITAKMTPIKDSRILKAVGYDDELETLYIRFRRAVYEYYDVPEKVYLELLKAPSAGSFFISKIQKTYNYNKIKTYKSKAGRTYKEGEGVQWVAEVWGQMLGAPQSEIVDELFGSTFKGMKGEVEEYLQNHTKMSLGDFVFRNPDGQEVSWETGNVLTMDEGKNEDDWALRAAGNPVNRAQDELYQKSREYLIKKLGRNPSESEATAEYDKRYKVEIPALIVKHKKELELDELQDSTPYFNKKTKVLISSEDLDYDLSNEVSGLNENSELEQYDELVRTGKVSMSKNSQTPLKISGWERYNGDLDIDYEISNYYVSDLESAKLFTNWYARNKNKNIYSVKVYFPDGTTYERKLSRTEAPGSDWIEVK